jgi:hypothetical protein
MPKSWFSRIVQEVGDDQHWCPCDAGCRASAVGHTDADGATLRWFLEAWPANACCFTPDPVGPSGERDSTNNEQKGASWRPAAAFLTISILEEASMDRIDAIKVLVTTRDEGSLAAAGRKLGRSPAAVSRAMAYVEGRVGVALLHGSTRASKPSDVGARYADTWRRLLTALDEADTLAVTAPALSGENV